MMRSHLNFEGPQSSTAQTVGLLNPQSLSYSWKSNRSHSNVDRVVRGSGALKDFFACGNNEEVYVVDCAMVPVNHSRARFPVDSSKCTLQHLKWNENGFIIAVLASTQEDDCCICAFSFDAKSGITCSRW